MCSAEPKLSFASAWATFQTVTVVCRPQKKWHSSLEIVLVRTSPVRGEPCLPPTGVLQASNGLRTGRRGRKILTHWENTPKSLLEQSMGGRSMDGVEPIRNLSLSNTQPYCKQRSPDTERQFTTISLRQRQTDAENVLFSALPVCYMIRKG